MNTKAARSRANKVLIAQLRARVNTAVGKPVHPVALTFCHDAGILKPLREKFGLKFAGVRAYSPDEVRDNHGRWTQGGDSAIAYTVPKAEYIATAQALLDKHGPTGSGLTPGKMTLEQQEKWFDAADKVRKAERDWENSARVAMSVGKLSIADAEARGYHPSGHDASDSASNYYYESKGLPKRGWQLLPGDLYHVTTAKSAVIADGLKSRDELGQQRGKGLGGGEDNTISFTTSKAGAENLYQTMHEARRVASGDIGVPRLLTAAEKGSGGSKPFLSEFMRSYDPKWKTGDPMPSELQEIADGRTRAFAGFGMKVSELPSNAIPVSTWKGGDGEDRAMDYTIPVSADKAAENRFDMYKRWLQYRESAGGPENPLFFMTDVKGLAQTPASELAIIHAKPVTGAQGYPMGALDEWRTHSGKAVKITDVETPQVQLRAMRAGGPGSGPHREYAWIDHPHLGVLTKAYSDSAGGAHAALAKRHDFDLEEFPRGHVWVDSGKKQFGVIAYDTGDKGIQPGLAGRLRSKLNIPRDYEIPRPKFTGPYSQSLVEAYSPDEPMSAGGPGSGPHPALHFPYAKYKHTGEPGRGHLAYEPQLLSGAKRNYPGMKHWVVFSLGASWHDPQGMHKIVSGPQVPADVAEVKTDSDYKAALEYVTAAEVAAYKRSRKMDYAGVDAYSVDEPRDERGRWTQGEGGPPAGVFVSPNRKEHLSFDQARKNLQAPRQQTFRKLAASLPNVSAVADVIGDWADGAENSLFVHITSNDPKDYLYTGAKLGLAMGQKAVLPFRTDPKGKDRLYTIAVPGTNLKTIRAALDKTGLKFRTLETHGQGTLIHIYDQGSKMLAQVAQARQILGGSVNMWKVTGLGANDGFLGSWNSREEGAKEYQKVIAGYKGQNVASGVYRYDRNRRGQGRRPDGRRVRASARAKAWVAIGGATGQIIAWRQQ